MISCQKDIEQTTMMDGVAPVLTVSSDSLSLTEAQVSENVLTISWTDADFGFGAAITYTVQVAAAGEDFSNAAEINTGFLKVLLYTGASLNDLAISKGIAAGSDGMLEIRVKASLSDSEYVYSATSAIYVKTYSSSLPALLVRGGGGWATPDERSNGYLLTSENYDGKYEGYIYLPNTNGWGGDGLKLQATNDGTIYGWGSDAYTMAAGASGDLWFTPAPAYMKVNADVNALTVNYTPVQFFISGDNNGWSTSLTPMTYDDEAKVWRAENVSFTAGQKFVFTSNGSYDISYKVDDDGKLIFAGPPSWAGNNITVDKTGTYTVTLDLSGGDGNYTYSIE